MQMALIILIRLTARKNVRKVMTIMASNRPEEK